MARAVATGQPSRPMAEIGQSVRMGWGIFHLFETGDNEQVFIGVTSNAHWERFCAILGLAEMYADDRLSTNEKRVVAQEWMLPKSAKRSRAYQRRSTGKTRQGQRPLRAARRPDQLWTIRISRRAAS